MSIPYFSVRTDFHEEVFSFRAGFVRSQRLRGICLQNPGSREFEPSVAISIHLGNFLLQVRLHPHEGVFLLEKRRPVNLLVQKEVRQAVEFGSRALQVGAKRLNRGSREAQSLLFPRLNFFEELFLPLIRQNAQRYLFLNLFGQVFLPNIALGAFLSFASLGASVVAKPKTALFDMLFGRNGISAFATGGEADEDEALVLAPAWTGASGEHCLNVIKAPL